MDQPTRRTFLNSATALAASASTALSYSRIRGANERISLGHNGVGRRGTDLDWIASPPKDKYDVEIEEYRKVIAQAIRYRDRVRPQYSHSAL